MSIFYRFWLLSEINVPTRVSDATNVHWFFTNNSTFYDLRDNNFSNNLNISVVLKKKKCIFSASSCITVVIVIVKYIIFFRLSCTTLFLRVYILIVFANKTIIKASFVWHIRMFKRDTDRGITNSQLRFLVIDKVIKTTRVSDTT